MRLQFVILDLKCTNIAAAFDDKILFKIKIVSVRILATFSILHYLDSVGDETNVLKSLLFILTNFGVIQRFQQQTSIVVKCVVLWLVQETIFTIYSLFSVSH